MSRYYSVLVITVVVINGLHCNSWRVPIDDERHLQLQSNEANNTYLNANIRLKS